MKRERGRIWSVVDFSPNSWPLDILSLSYHSCSLLAFIFHLIADETHSQIPQSWSEAKHTHAFSDINNHTLKCIRPRQTRMQTILAACLSSTNHHKRGETAAPPRCDIYRSTGVINRKHPGLSNMNKSIHPIYKLKEKVWKRKITRDRQVGCERKICRGVGE